MRTRAWASFWVLAIGATLTLMDQSLVSIALASIQREFGADGVVIQLLVIGHALTYAVTLLPAGRLGDAYGHRRMLMIALVLLCISAAIASFAPTISILGLARVLQGAGAGLLTPQIMGLIQHLFPPEQRARPMGILSAVMAAPMAVGPSIGGVLIQLAGNWRIVFIVTLTAEVVVTALAFALLKRGASRSPLQFDVPSLVLLAPALAGLVVPLSLISGGMPTLWLSLGLVVMGAVFAVVFLRRQRRLSSAQPSGGRALLDVTLLGIPTFATGIAIAGLGYATSSGSGIVVNLYLQQGAGLSPAIAALCIIPNAVAIAISSWWVGRHPAHTMARFVRIGTVIAAGAYTAIAMVAALGRVEVFPVALTVMMAVIGFSNGMYTAPNQTETLSEVPLRRSASAASVMQLSQRMGMSVGASVGMSTYFAFDTEGGSAAGAAGALLVSAALVLVAHLVSLTQLRRGRLDCDGSLA